MRTLGSVLRDQKGPWRQSEVLKEPRVQLRNGLNRTKGLPTSVSTPRGRRVTKVSCPAGPAKARWRTENREFNREFSRIRGAFGLFAPIPAVISMGCRAIP